MFNVIPYRGNAVEIFLLLVLVLVVVWWQVAPKHHDPIPSSFSTCSDLCASHSRVTGAVLSSTPGTKTSTGCPVWRPTEEGGWGFPPPPQPPGNLPLDVPVGGTENTVARDWSAPGGIFLFLLPLPFAEGRDKTAL